MADREIRADKHSGFRTGAQRLCAWGMRCRTRTPHSHVLPVPAVALWLLSTHPGVVWLHNRPVCLVCGVCRHHTPRTRFFRFPGVLDNASMSCATGRVSDVDMVVCCDYVGCIHMLKSSRLNEMWRRCGCWRVAGILDPASSGVSGTIKGVKSRTAHDPKPVIRSPSLRGTKGRRTAGKHHRKARRTAGMS